VTARPIKFALQVPVSAPPLSVDVQIAQNAPKDLAASTAHVFPTHVKALGALVQQIVTAVPIIAVTTDNAFSAHRVNAKNLQGVPSPVAIPERFVMRLLANANRSMTLVHVRLVPKMKSVVTAVGVAYP